MNSRKLWNRLRNREFRKYFVASQVKRGIPLQMRALLKKYDWTQGQLADHAELTQGAVSRALNPSYGNLTLNTIVRIAAGFDVAFVGKFVPFSRLVEEFEDLSEEDLQDVPTFEEEDRESDHREELVADPLIVWEEAKRMGNPQPSAPLRMPRQEQESGTKHLLDQIAEQPKRQAKWPAAPAQQQKGTPLYG